MTLAINNNTKDPELLINEADDVSSDDSKLVRQKWHTKKYPFGKLLFIFFIIYYITVYILWIHRLLDMGIVELLSSCLLALEFSSIPIASFCCLKRKQDPCFIKWSRWFAQEPKLDIRNYFIPIWKLIYVQ